MVKPKVKSPRRAQKPKSVKSSPRKAADKAPDSVGKSVKARKPGPGRDTKQAQMITLLRRPKGATIEELTAATGWQQHSVRGALSGALKKRLGLMIESSEEDRGRVYRIIETAAETRA